MIKATDENIQQLVYDGIDKYGPRADLNYIDTSEVTDMSCLFNEIDFNGDISEWDTSNVTTMKFMFCNCNFNGDISKWDVHNVMNTRSMFERCVFNCDISGWDVHNVEDMKWMFNNNVYDKEITWDVDIEKLFGDEYNDYLERRKLKVMEDLCVF